MPRGRQDVVIPKLIPDEQVTISYLYLQLMPLIKHIAENHATNKRTS
jgi:hypothetical protein